MVHSQSNIVDDVSVWPSEWEKNMQSPYHPRANAIALADAIDEFL
jgi:hypothetical protein